MALRRGGRLWNVEEKRRQIVNDHDVTPVAHLPLLAGQTKHSDVEQLLGMNIIFLRQYIRLTEKEIIQCGMGLQESFLIC